MAPARLSPRRTPLWERGLHLTGGGLLALACLFGLSSVSPPANAGPIVTTRAVTPPAAPPADHVPVVPALPAPAAPASNGFVVPPVAPKASAPAPAHPSPRAASAHGASISDEELARMGPFPLPPELQGVDLLRQTAAAALEKSQGCVHCHQNTCDPHRKDTLRIGCTDCHGGDAKTLDKMRAHVQPRMPQVWTSSANPPRTYTAINKESPEFVRFVNPGDLRIAHISCGTINCHPKEVLQVKKSMMSTGCMLWGAAQYNNGAVPSKRALHGECYSMHGVPLAIQSVPPPDEWERTKKGVLDRLDPLPRFEASQPGNILRFFERGGKTNPEIGNPSIFADPGRPFLERLSDRGLGTKNRTDPVMLGLQKTRLFNPSLFMIGTNDHPGDYRHSGCTACHVIYANDRSRVHSGPYAKYGNRGYSYSKDPCIPKQESGHPIDHAFAKGNGIPSSQCMVCHMHPGTTVMNSYFGMMWWDEETDGELIYPQKQKYPTAEQYIGAHVLNPNESAAKNKLTEPGFLEEMVEINKQCQHTQFADFHGHGWAYRAVFRQDRKGTLIDHYGDKIEKVDNAKLQQAMRFQKLPPRERVHAPGVPVHMMDIHIEKGMHCIDCHFVQDMHGNTRIQQEVRAAVEIQCIDCHGTWKAKPTLHTSGPASYTSGQTREEGRDLSAMRTPWGRKRFEWRGEKLLQWSMVEEDLCWEMPLTKDTITPGHPRYNAKSHAAKTARMNANGEIEFGDVPEGGEKCLAHQDSNMSCQACHSSWNPSCYGCHLPQKANAKLPNLAYEGDVTRNYISYNFQTLREEVFMLGRDGDATNNRINPSRSSCAIHVGSHNANRESIYFQQQTISACGLSGIAFSTNVPHTVRGKDGTKTCTDCHLAAKNDNNAILAQLFMHGTNYLNFMGKYCWVAAGEHGFEAVQVTEQQEPQAVIGSHLHKLAFPDDYAKHQHHHKVLQHAVEHPGKDIAEQFFRPGLKLNVSAIQNRGEYLYAACGEGGVRIFDISMTDHKGFGERIFTAPVSPVGQQFYVRTKYATSLAAPTTIAPDPTREGSMKGYPQNKEQAVSLLYAFVYVTDKYEGLILIGAGTLLDGNPLNNFLKREVTFNPNGILNGAKSISIIGHYAYICADAGLVVVSLENPKEPKVVSVLGDKVLKKPHSVSWQFRYGFVCDEEGIKVLDITDPGKPKPVAKMKLPHAHNMYVARTYGYVACGEHGLVILDLENPEQPKIDQTFTAGGTINDLHDVKLGITYTSEFAYLADGKNGLKVVQLTGPKTPGNSGFSPRPTPELVATYKLPEGGHALSIPKGVDRDRAIDESGNQLAVFGRIGARPLSLAEQQKMYMRKDKSLWRVEDGDPLKSKLYKYVRTPR